MSVTDRGPRRAPRPGPARVLPLGMADFAGRGFRLDRPAEREVLERHARWFLTGFNTAVRHWRDPHPALAEVPAAERGFAYEGAGMHAALRDRLTPWPTGALDRLLSGPGDRYAHLISVGYGWAVAPATTVLRLPLPAPRPPSAQPLLRCLALDGAGFAETYFGGLAALRRRARRPGSPRWEAVLAGSGRALWFAESADVDGVAAVIGSLPEPARPHVWAGVGLASCYAGCADAAALDRLRAAAGPHRWHLGQGALFAVAARDRSGIVPDHTSAAAAHLFGTDPATARRWTDEAADGLTGSADLSAYAEWKARLRERVARLG
ncbi:DUF1702 family protein [Saccharothrix lopnurensis]|uniref:DUF1702 family protein n=1 Tax=Saccharothrix lopnurensis TaxID=1670621 RepID=A0ABW1PGQ0_9PSEU